MPQLFEPKAGQETQFAFQKTPTYLFRLYDPHSAGVTDTDHVKSPYASTDLSKEAELRPSCGTDLLQLEDRHAADNLDRHLMRGCKGLERNLCNLMSWSSSLLFLLQYGLYRNSPKSTTRSGLSEISIIMIDTRDFPNQTFLRDMDALDYFYRRHNPLLETVRNLRKRDLYFGEYLTQGCLDIRGKCVQMTMQQLIDGGLLTVICPALDEKENWSSWARIVRQLRKGIRNNDAVDKRQIRTAISLAQVYGGDKFVIPLALMLLGLRSRQSDNALILEAFRGIFTDQDLTLAEINHDLESNRILADGSACMEELKRFQELAEMIRNSSKETSNKESQGDQVAAISESFQRLSTNAASDTRARRYQRRLRKT